MKKVLKKWWIYPIIMGLITLIFPYSNFLDISIGFMFLLFFSIYTEYLRRCVLPLPKDRSQWSGNDKSIKIQMAAAMFFVWFFSIFISIFGSIISPIGKFLGIFGLEKMNYDHPWNLIILFIIYLIIMIFSIIMFSIYYFNYLRDTGWGEKYWPKETKDEHHSTGANGNIIV